LRGPEGQDPPAARAENAGVVFERALGALAERIRSPGSVLLGQVREFAPCDGHGACNPSCTMRALMLLTVLCAGCVRPIAQAATRGVVDALAPPAAQREQAAAAAADPEHPQAALPETPLTELTRQVTRAMLAELADRGPQITAFLAQMTRTAARVATEESQHVLRQAIAEDIAQHGVLAQAIESGTQRAVHAAFVGSAAELRQGLEACPPGASLRDCVHREATAIAGDVAEGVYHRLRVPIMLFIIGLIALIFALCVAAVVFLVRFIRGPRSGVAARLPGAPWPHDRPRGLRPI
jgi:hypothetical protein